MSTTLPKERYVSISDIIAFKSCRQRWDFGSPLRQNWQPRFVSKHLRLGAGIHSALEQYYRSDPRDAAVMQSSFETWAEQELAEIPENEATESRTLELYDMIDLGRGMLEHYATWAARHDDFDVIEPEVQFRLPLPFFPDQYIYFVGRADGWVKRKGEYFLLEHKTCRNFPPFNALFLDEQCIAYQWATQVSPKFDGKRPKGTIYTFLLKAVPEVPRQLQNGGLSQAQSMKTTAEIYEQELNRLHLPKSLYMGFLQSLRDRPNQFFSRVTIERADRAMFKFGTNIVSVVREMTDPLVAIYPTPNWYVCPRCAFNVPCTMAQNGIDPLPVLVADYVQAKGRYEFGEEEEA